METIVEVVENEQYTLFKYLQYDEDDFDVLKFSNGAWLYYDNVGKVAFEESIKSHQSYVVKQS